MTDEPGQERGPSRRKFDDVASLFGTIVPGPLAVPRAVDEYPGPYVAREPPPVSVPVEVPIPVRVVEPLASPRLVKLESKPRPEPRPEPKPLPRPRPAEILWPDAFEPRPNFRRREPRNWSWLLLIPVGFVAAVGIATLNPRAIRSWLDANVFHRTLTTASTVAPLLTTPPSPQVAAAPPAELPVPYPAIPTSPVPVPADVEVSPPPVPPAEAAAAAAVPLRIMIQYRRNIPGSDGEARRIAALLQSHGGSIELHPNATSTRVPTITYYNPADKPAATALATALANEAATWVVRAGATKYPPGTLDVWLP